MVTKQEVLARTNPVLGLPSMKQAYPKGTTIQNLQREKEHQRLIRTNPVLGLPSMKPVSKKMMSKIFRF